NRRNSSTAASRSAGTPTDGRARLGIGAVMAPMPASAGAAPTAGTAGSCRDTTAPRGSHRHTASGPSPEQAAVPASAGHLPASEQRGDGEWAPPLRLSRRLLVLAGEQRRRKLRRITTLLRRMRMVFAGARVRLHDLAIEMPGRMAE